MHSAIADHLGHSMAANELARGFGAPGRWFGLRLLWFSQRIFDRDCLWRNPFPVAERRALRRRLLRCSRGGWIRGMTARHGFGRGIGRLWGRFLRVTAIASVFYYAVFLALGRPSRPVRPLAVSEQRAGSAPLLPGMVALGAVVLLLFCRQLDSRLHPRRADSPILNAPRWQRLEMAPDLSPAASGG